MIEVEIFIESMSSKEYQLTCAPIRDSDQHAHHYSLTRVFNGRSMCSQGSNFSTGGIQIENTIV